MGEIERRLGTESSRNPPKETLDPRHFYAAYIFDRANERDEEIQVVLKQAQALNYQTRYWWLSDAMELQGFPDRLIVCVHHPSTSEDAGMDLYESLKERETSWDDLEAAAIDEYRYLGRPVQELGDLRSPFGNWLFPHVVPKERRLPDPENTLLLITPDDVREELHERLGREATGEELASVLVWFRRALDRLGWAFYLDEAIKMSVEDRWVGMDDQELSAIQFEDV